MNQKFCFYNIAALVKLITFLLEVLCLCVTVLKCSWSVIFMEAFSGHFSCLLVFGRNAFRKIIQRHLHFGRSSVNDIFIQR